MPSTQKLELEIGVLESRKTAIESDLAYKREQHNSSMPCDEGMSDKNVAGLIMSSLVRDRDRLLAEIAGKRLALFDVVGATATDLQERADDTPPRDEIATPPSTQRTHAEQILRGASAVAGVDGHGDFTRKQVRERIGVSAHEWQSGYTAIFQAMRDDQPGGAPQIGEKYRAVLHRVAHGTYKLNALGRRMVSDLGAENAG